MERVESLKGDFCIMIGGRPSAPPRPLAVGLLCAAVAFIFYLIRVAEREALKWRDVALLTDLDGDIVLRIALPK